MSKELKIAETSPKKSRGRPRQNTELPMILGSPVKGGPWKRLHDYFTSIDPTGGITSMRAFLFVWLSPDTYWFSSNESGSYLPKEAVERIYQIGKNSIGILDLVADLRRFNIHVKTKKIKGQSKNFFVIVTDVELPLRIKSDALDLLNYSHDDDDLVFAHSGRKWEAESDEGLIPLGKPKLDPEPGSIQETVISVLNKEQDWYAEIKKHLQEMVKLASVMHFNGEMNLTAFRRNLAIIRKIGHSCSQSYTISLNSARIYGDGFNQLTRELRQYLEKAMNWVVADLKACQLTAFAYRYGFERNVALLSDPRGFWNALLDGYDSVTQEEKSEYKTNVQALLFGRQIPEVKRNLEETVGTKNARSFVAIPAITEIAEGINEIINDLINGGSMLSPSGQELRLKPDHLKRKHACSLMSLWAQEWEMHYAGNLLIAAESAQAGRIRALLHDGITLAHLDSATEEVLSNKLDKLNEKSEIIMKLDFT